MTYEEVVVGEEIDHREFKITSEMQQNYLEALEDNNPLYIKGDPSKEPIAHPVLILNNAFPAEWIASFKEHIHAKNYVQFLNPTRVGKKIVVRSKVYEKYIRRGRIYVTTEFTCVDEDGLEVALCRWTETHGTVDE
jgi:acyl dehydratase